MNRSLFHGWKDIFSFTFKQSTSEKNFKLATIGITVALFLVGAAISVIMAIGQQKDANKVSPIEVVHVIDESGMEVLYLDGFLESNKEKYPNVSFRMEESTVEAVSQQISKQGEEDIKDVILHIASKEKGYLMTLYLPEGSALSKDDGEDFLEQVTMVMEQSKLFSSGIPMEKLVLVMSGISVTTLDAGEKEKSLGEELVGLLFPMISALFIYMMTLLYGQSIGNVVSVEKTSKLMEMVLTMTRPYGLIFGKILAMTSVAIMQTVLWIGGFVVGFLMGDVVAGQVIYPEYNNVVLEVFEQLRNQDGSSAFTIGAFLVAFITICIAFLFYCVLAGMLASFADKPETLSQMMGYYTIFVVIGFMGAYLVPIQEKEWLSTLMRIIPVTSAYMLPGDIVVGNITVLESILYLAILLVCTVALVIVTGKIYKDQLFYRGTGLKDRFKRKKKVNA